VKITARGLLTATEDYRLGAIGFPAEGYELGQMRVLSPQPLAAPPTAPSG